MSLDIPSDSPTYQYYASGISTHTHTHTMELQQVCADCTDEALRKRGLQVLTGQPSS